MTNTVPTAQPGQSGDDREFRLPRAVAPRRYDLRLAPDLDQAVFDGEVRMEIEVLDAVDRIVMNALELDIADASLVQGWASTGDDVDDVGAFSLGIELDTEAERVTFLAPSEDVPPGRYTLSAVFSGKLNDKLRGFYRSVFTDETGRERVVATTQFEETDARRAFPCFDEPDRKAVFSITVDVPVGMLAVSNGPEIEATDIAGGRRRVRFGDTIAMSTYLVAVVVGPLEATAAVDVDGVALRVVHAPGKSALTGTAIETATHALRFYTEYFGQRYPGTKIDLVAVPDFASGAMENLGCVTFREAILLADPARSARVEIERIAEVVAHELAHMWFGDLVTMRWWNGIWLNEAFATFMALCCQDDFRPEWHVFSSFARSRSVALGVDGLHSTRSVEYPVRQPDDAAAMFDVLTYEKGASVLWMAERYLGRERFRAGVRRYLAAHAYGNTETHDLWDAIEAEAGDVPIRDLMESWIFQGGYPIVSASTVLGEDGTELVEIGQSPFAYLPTPPSGESAIGSGWIVPVLAAPVGEGDVRRVLLRTEPLRIPSDSGPLVVNAGGSGFFRVHYDTPLRTALLASFESMSPLERYVLVSDTWATCLAGSTRLGEFADVLARLGTEQDPHVWSAVVGALGLIDQVAPDGARAAVASYVRDLLSPQLARVGWEVVDGEDEQTPLLRAALVSTLGTVGRDPDVSSRCRALFQAEVAGEAAIEPDISGAVLAVVAHGAGRSEIDAILDRYRHPHDPIDEVRHLYALGHLGDETLAAEVLELTLTEIRSQNGPYLLGSMLANRSIGPLTWRFVKEHFDQARTRFPENSIHRMLEGVTGLAQVDGSGAALYAADVRGFLDRNVQGARRRLVAQSLERLDVNVAMARRLPGELAELAPGA